MSTGHHVHVVSSNLERYVSEEERRLQAIPHPTSEQLQYLRAAGLPEHFDDPKIMVALYAGMSLDASPEPTPYSCLMHFEGTQCLVFGHGPANDIQRTVVVILFQDNCEDGDKELNRLAVAYMVGVSVRVVVPLSSPLPSCWFQEARTLIEAIKVELSCEAFILHGIGRGSIFAIHAAAEFSQRGTTAPVELLVLETGIASMLRMPGMAGILMELPKDPLLHRMKLGLTRCPVVLVRGVPPIVDEFDELAGWCSTTPTKLSDSTSCPGDGLLSELVQAAQKAVERATKKAKKTY